jgi:hypothetical protein
MSDQFTTEQDALDYARDVATWKAARRVCDHTPVAEAPSHPVDPVTASLARTWQRALDREANRANMRAPPFDFRAVNYLPAGPVDRMPAAKLRLVIQIAQYHLQRREGA